MQAQRARYLDQIADAVLEGGRAEIICEEVKRWSNVAYDNDEAWKAGGEGSSCGRPLRSGRLVLI